MKFPGRSARAFTLIESLVAMVAVGAVGYALFSTLYMGLMLYSKNACLNVSHEQVREAMMHLEQDIHSSASLPELTDSNSNILTSATSASAGVTFQVVTSGSTRAQIIANAASSATQLTIGFPSSMNAPYAGENIIIPYYQIENSITAVSISGTQATLTLSGSIGTPLTVSFGSSSYNIPCYLTKRVFYVVTGGPTSANPSAPYMLNYTGVGTRKSFMLTSQAACAQPFTLPNPINGTTFSQFVVGINLYSQCPQFSARNYESAAILMTGQISPYATITSFQ